MHVFLDPNNQCITCMFAAIYPKLDEIFLNIYPFGPRDEDGWCPDDKTKQTYETFFFDYKCCCKFLDSFATRRWK